MLTTVPLLLPTLWAQGLDAGLAHRGASAAASGPSAPHEVFLFGLAFLI